MKIVLRSQCISPHLNPFVSALDKLAGGVKFVYATSDQGENRRRIGWHHEVDFEAVQDNAAEYAEARRADVVVDMLRDVDLMAERARNGLKTYYCGERWFKPRLGMLRMACPSYFRMARRFAGLFKMKPFSALAIGVHSARDLLRVVFLLRGDIRMFFKSPEVAFESRPGGCVVPLKSILDAHVLTDAETAFAKRNGYVQIPREHWGEFRPEGAYAKIRMWGYFVERGSAKDASEADLTERKSSETRVLWAGRMLRWKRVGDLVRAAEMTSGLRVDIYGRGPCRRRLLGHASENVVFHDYIGNADLRREMHRHDVYVLPSDASEGWGAVVSESLAEGVRILATAESGAGATLLPVGNLYNAGDLKALCEKLSGPIEAVETGMWTGEFAARAFLGMIEGK